MRLAVYSANRRPFSNMIDQSLHSNAPERAAPPRFVVPALAGLKTLLKPTPYPLMPYRILTFPLSHFLTLFLLLATYSASAKLTPEQVKLLPPAATRQVAFGKDIRPILEASCIKCHGRGRTKGDFQLDTRETLLKGGGSGPAVVPRKSEESYLIE